MLNTIKIYNNISTAWIHILTYSSGELAV